MSNDGNIIDEFNAKAGEPFFWFLMADDMYCAAKTLWTKYEEMSHVYFSEMPKKSTNDVKLTPAQDEAQYYLRLKFPFLYMCGMAFENALKGLLILRDPTLIEDGKVSEEIAKGHKLITLFEKAEIALSSEEVNLIVRIGDSVNWSARYPVPKKAKDFKLFKIPGKGYTMPGNYLQDDQLKIEIIMGRVSSIIKSEYGESK